VAVCCERSDGTSWSHKIRRPPSLAEDLSTSEEGRCPFSWLCNSNVIMCDAATGNQKLQAVLRNVAYSAACISSPSVRDSG